MISVYALVKQLGIGVVIAEESWSCREGAVSGGCGFGRGAVSDGVRSREAAVSGGLWSRGGCGLRWGAVSGGCGLGPGAVLGRVRSQGCGIGQGADLGWLRSCAGCSLVQDAVVDRVQFYAECSFG